jgi:hypothetical protein
MLCINGFDQYRYSVVQPDLYYTCAKLNPHGGTETGPLKVGYCWKLLGTMEFRNTCQSLGMRHKDGPVLLQGYV